MNFDRLNERADKLHMLDKHRDNSHGADLVRDCLEVIESQAAEIEAMKECVRFLRIAVGFDKDYDEAEDEAKEALARLDAIRGAK